MFHLTLTLNGIYSCIARLLKHKTLEEEEQALPMTRKIPPRHFPKINKVVNLYFSIQYLR